MFFVLIATALALFLGYIWHLGGHWARRKVPAPEPSEFFGRLWKNITLAEHFGLLVHEAYK